MENFNAYSGFVCCMHICYLHIASSSTESLGIADSLQWWQKNKENANVAGKRRTREILKWKGTEPNVKEVEEKTAEKRTSEMPELGNIDDGTCGNP